MAGNAVASVPEPNRAQQAITNLSSGVSNIYSTIEGSNVEEKLQILDAVTNAEPLADHLEEPFKLKHVIAQATSVEDANTGESRDAVRTVLITDEDKAYAAVSDGIFMSLQNIFAIMGHPSTWVEPLPVKVSEVKGRKGYRFMTVKVSKPA